MQKFFNILFLITLITIKSAFGASSQAQNHQISNAKTLLIASFYEDNGVKKLVAGVKFQLETGWKIYGNDTSGIGMPPQFNFSNSQNYKNHNVFYPPALDGEEKIGKDSLKYKYYEGEIIFPIFIDIIDLQTPTILNLKLDFALCKDVCVPVSQNFSLNIDTEIDFTIIKQIENFYDKKLIETNANQASDDSFENFNNIDLSLKSHKKSDQSSKIYLMIFLAIIGGAILNIMPCVLPVISIKLISIIKHSGASVSRIRFSFLATIIGILSCFILLSFLTFAIRSTGNFIGWGFQFQNPYFLIFLIIILVFFIAELLGVFEISFNQFLTNILNKKIDESQPKKHIFIPNFLSGILAVLLATPCSAPFLGSAISFALTQDFITIFTIFIFIGIGFSLPYLILILSPNLLKLIPKPGAWMIKIKHLMAGFLFATIIWLIFVLSGIIGLIPCGLVALFSILIFTLLKLKSMITKFSLISLLIILSITLPIKLYNQQEQRQKVRESYWQVFDESILNNLISQDKVILVDITADWCLTCKFNKILVLNDAEIEKMLKSGEIIGLRADITKPDDDVMKFLAKHNRFAIPFNAVYGPKAKNGLLSSEFLNKDELLRLIAQSK